LAAFQESVEIFALEPKPAAIPELDGRDSALTCPRSHGRDLKTKVLAVAS